MPDWPPGKALSNRILVDKKNKNPEQKSGSNTSQGRESIACGLFLLWPLGMWAFEHGTILLNPKP